MNREELIGKLQMVYVGDKNALNELIGYYDGLKDVIKILQQENARLKEIENKLNFIKNRVKQGMSQENRQRRMSMQVINEYTLEIFDVYKVHVEGGKVYFLVWNDFDGWMLLDAEFTRPYKPLIG